MLRWCWERTSTIRGSRPFIVDRARVLNRAWNGSWTGWMVSFSNSSISISSHYTFQTHLALLGFQHNFGNCSLACTKLPNRNKLLAFRRTGSVPRRMQSLMVACVDECSCCLSNTTFTSFGVRILFSMTKQNICIKSYFWFRRAHQFGSMEKAKSGTEVSAWDTANVFCAKLKLLVVK